MTLRRRMVQGVLLLIAFWFLGNSLYIHAKALLAQQLLESAWDDALTGEVRPKPWSWADTWPVARIRVDRLGIDQIVLAGASGRVLAFGPGHVSGTAPPGTAGNSVISGHRDTHFAWLRALQTGDRLQVELPDRQLFSYAVTAAGVHHQSETGILSQEGGIRLTLLTCYPFEAIDPGGPLRYAVTAEPVVM